MSKGSPVIYLLRYALPASLLALGLALSPVMRGASPTVLFILSFLPVLALAGLAYSVSEFWAAESRRKLEQSAGEHGNTSGSPPQRDAYEQEIKSAQDNDLKCISKYLLGFESESGEPIWVNDDDICGHACIVGKNGSGKTSWLGALALQQMTRGRGGGFTFIDGRRDPSTLAHLVVAALATGRIDDLLIIDPLAARHTYDPLQAEQSGQVKAGKVLKTIRSISSHFARRDDERVSYDIFMRLVKALDMLGASWSIHDLAELLLHIEVAFPVLQKLLIQVGAKDLAHTLEQVLMNASGEGEEIDYPAITATLSEITLGVERMASALPSFVQGPLQHSDLEVEKMLRSGKIVYYALPTVENPAQAHILEEMLREDLMASVITLASSRDTVLEDPHLIFLDDIPTESAIAWAQFLDSARRARCACIFSASSLTGRSEHGFAPSRAFYERIIAHVHIKVMLRIDDLQSTADLIDWFGRMIAPNPGNLPTVVSESARTIKGGIHFDSKVGRDVVHAHPTLTAASQPQQVANETLMRKLVGDRGLAWFDAGNGKVIRGRTFWLDAELPGSWDGRDQVSVFQHGAQGRLDLHELIAVSHEHVQLIGSSKNSSRGTRLSVLKNRKGGGQ